jgi:hypothetical protein
MCALAKHREMMVKSDKQSYVCFSATPRDDGEERQAELCGALAQHREMMVRDVDDKSDKQCYMAL